ncbi:MAG: response regulator [Desulfobacteraceae bacterium]|nr:MAG: response regulator [Desulfobacteraceae bacterium]
METTAKIIVVDDEERICRNIKKILSKNNFEVTHALSAREALEKMAGGHFALMLSDIVMPGENGIELLKRVKKEWPQTKAVMMTAYASTETAVKAIRLGALDYIAKPFTPEELRKTIGKAMAGEIKEAPTSQAEREAVDVIDIDIPFKTGEVAQYTGEDYAKRLGPSDMPVVEVKMPEPLANFCEVGVMVCDIFKKLGATCKAGTKSGECPQKKAKKTKGAGKEKGTDFIGLIGIDQPFNYDEVVSVTGPEYVRNLHHEGVSFVPYEELKKGASAPLTAKRREIIDTDMPFDSQEVAGAAGEAYSLHLTRSDMPAVEITASVPPAGFCEVGTMVCDIFKKLGATCKAGTKSGECPQKKAQKTKGAGKEKGVDAATLIGIDQPFDYREVEAAAGPEYVRNLFREDFVVRPYAELKEQMRLSAEETGMRAIPDLNTAAEASADILVIDDEVAVNNNIRKILQKNNLQVDQAVSRAEAMEKIQERPYKIVLLDLRMPGVKGLELLQAIRDRNPAAKVIIVTGYASIETAVESTRLGAFDYLAKPFTPDEIRKVTEKAFLLAA